VDDIIALLAREAGKKFVEAQKAAALEAAKRNAAAAAAATAPAAPAGTNPQVRNAWAKGIVDPRRGAASAGKTAAPTPAQRLAAASPPPPPQPARQRPPRAPAPPAIDAFVIPEFAPEPPHPSIALLAAFSGGTSLLAGIVLSEALAPPIALRRGQLFERLER
jgi:hypothetical protein